MTGTGGTPPWGTPPRARPYGEPGHSWAPEPDSAPDGRSDDGFDSRFDGGVDGAVEAGEGGGVRRPYAPYPEPSRAALALVLALAGLFAFPPLSPAGWIVGRRELRAIDAGRRNPRSRGTAQTAVVLGVVGTLVLVVGVLAVVFVVSLFAAALGALLHL